MTEPALADDPAHSLEASLAAAPEADEHEPAEPTKPLGSIRTLVTVAFGVLILTLVVHAVMAGRTLLLQTALNAGFIEERPAQDLWDKLGAWSAPIGYAFYATLAAAAASYLWFVFRGTSNIRKTSRRFVPRSPTGAVVWHFVPMMNLIQPYAIVTQLWIRSHDPEKGEGKSPATAMWWWGCWLLANVALWQASVTQQGVDASLLVGEAVGDAAYDAVERAILVFDFSLIASIVFLLPIIGGIARAQDHPRDIDAFS